MTATLVDPSGAEHQLSLDGAMAWHVAIGPEGQVIGNPGISQESAPLALVGLMLGGPDTIPIGDSFFDVFADLSLPPNPVGPNTIKEATNMTRGILDVAPFTAQGSADAFFDVFFDLTLMSDQSPAPGDERTLVLHPQAAINMGSTIDHKPPTGGATFAPATDVRVPLLDASGAPSGFFLARPSISVAATVPVTRVLECYRIEKGQDANDPFALITKNFGRDDVLVRNSTQFCEGAIKAQTVVAGIAPPPVVWQCFNLANGESPGVKFRVTTNNFGDDQVTVRKAVLLCEDAVKTRVTSTGQVTSTGHASGRVYECYTAAGQAGAEAVCPDDAQLRAGQRPRDAARPALRARKEGADHQLPAVRGHDTVGQPGRLTSSVNRPARTGRSPTGRAPPFVSTAAAGPHVGADRVR